jgi:hypothetical protein
MYANDATPKNTTSVSQCPCCCQALETQVHMLHCRDNPSRSKSLTKFKTHCKRRRRKLVPSYFRRHNRSMDDRSQHYSNL